MKQTVTTVILIIFIYTKTIETRATNYLQQLNYIASQNPYVTYIFKSKFSSEDIYRKSMDMALQSCQNSFQLQRWNCPSSDFYRRYKKQPQWLDPEDVYVNAIVTAALLYNINKDCSSGLFTDCGCQHSASCSDDTKKAEQLYRQQVHKGFNLESNEFMRKVLEHNLDVVTTLLRQSLVQKCSENSENAEEKNVFVLKPFEVIAEEIYRMHQNALQLSRSHNAKIMWHNVPLDDLVYTVESANYCDIEAVPFWNGMRGRTCQLDSAGSVAGSCQYLCTDCGHMVRARRVITETQCNCTHIWNFKINCETCMTVQKQHFCY